MDATSVLVCGAAPATTGSSPRTLQLRRGEASPAMLAKLKSVAKGFDTIFTGTLINELMQPAVGAGLGGSGPGASIVQGMIEQNLADHLSKAGGFGIGRMLVKQLKPMLGVTPVEAGDATLNEGLRKAVDASAAPAVSATSAIDPSTNGGGER